MSFFEAISPSAFLQAQLCGTLQQTRRLENQLIGANPSLGSIFLSAFVSSSDWAHRNCSAKGGAYDEGLQSSAPTTPLANNKTPGVADLVDGGGRNHRQPRRPGDRLRHTLGAKTLVLRNRTGPALAPILILNTGLRPETTL